MAHLHVCDQIKAISHWASVIETDIPALGDHVGGVLAAEVDHVATNFNRHTIVPVGVN